MMHGKSELFCLFKTVRMNTNNRDPAHLSMDISRTVNILRLPGTAVKCLIAFPSNQMLFDAVLKAFSMVPLHMITHKYTVLKKDIHYHNIFSVGEDTYRVPCYLSCRKLAKLFEENRKTT